jgi:glycolate oxidase
MKEIVDATLSRGGTITGEHGIGLAKKAFLPTSSATQLLSLLKTHQTRLDPDGLLNPGKIFD